MPDSSRRMILGTVINSTGLHLAGWRYPSVAPAENSFAHYARMAAIAERGKLDFLFFADSLAMMYANDPDVLQRLAPLNDYDPIILLSAVSVTTKNVGLIASATTTYNEPFHLARKFASLDKISGGRAGWNVITSVNPDEANNFAHMAQIPLEERYRRALECVKVACDLWDSWGDDAVVADKESALFYDNSKVRTIDHKGDFFSVKGPLTVQRPPQGHPVIVQSGSSDTGRSVGARIADVVFTAQQSLKEAQAFYRDVKARVADVGRPPEQVKVIPGVVPIIGRTMAEAKEKFDKIQMLIHPDVGLALLGHLLGEVDLKVYPLDGPVPDIPVGGGKHSRLAMLLDLARRENMTIRQLYMHVAAGARGHWTVHGDAKHIADVLEEWFRNEGADGFSVIPPFFPEGLEDIVDVLVPELQRRGLFHEEYAPGNFRQKMGLANPHRIAV
ncbi:Nitrilotriacetate monooxygenase component A [Hyphomicrobiales bacterium]|nr:Nitrilotriacetate monooxygenase component A [Hyphomicrobiales bacterium]CAH1671419.1 Nitrilotriacetate monooxygenase component A [Hyphomicrobiales bacterium]